MVDRERQPRFAAAARADGGARAQRVVEVGRVHLRALLRRARPPPRRRRTTPAPRLLERAVAWAVLQARGVEAVVERTDVRGRRAEPAAGQRLIILMPGYHRAPPLRPEFRPNY